MSNESPDALIDRHEAFLECRAVDRPLLGHWIGGYYPAEQFPRAASAWGDRAAPRPEDLSFAAFAEDYEQLYQAHRACDDDFFYVGSAYWGVPWLEAILGCPVAVSGGNGRAEPCLRNLDDAERPVADPRRNSWLKALLDFTRNLVEFSDGRFPVCPPLLRGPGDAAAAMLGGTVFVTGLIDEPRRMKTLLAHCAQVRSTVLEHLGEILPAWHGTHAAGGYPSKVWCRRTVAYYQEDCAALLSPRLFREFLLPLAQQTCRAAAVNFIHLHSACLYPLDVLLDDGPFDVIEVNIDHAGAGPSVSRLLPALQRIQAARRPLLLWGDCAPEDWELLRRELSPAGLSMQPMLRANQKPGGRP